MDITEAKNLYEDTSPKPKECITVVYREHEIDVRRGNDNLMFCVIRELPLKLGERRLNTEMPSFNDNVSAMQWGKVWVDKKIAGQS